MAVTLAFKALQPSGRLSFRFSPDSDAKQVLDVETAPPVFILGSADVHQREKFGSSAPPDDGTLRETLDGQVFLNFCDCGIDWN